MNDKPVITYPLIIPVRYDGRDLEIYVDHEDADLLIGRRLTIRKGQKTYYAFLDGVALHRLIMGVHSNIEIHHVSTNGLDNRRKNLRIVTPEGHGRYHSGNPYI